MSVATRIELYETAPRRWEYRVFKGGRVETGPWGWTQGKPPVTAADVFAELELVATFGGDTIDGRASVETKRRGGLWDATADNPRS